MDLRMSYPITISSGDLKKNIHERDVTIAKQRKQIFDMENSVKVLNKMMQFLVEVVCVVSVLNIWYCGCV